MSGMDVAPQALGYRMTMIHLLKSLLCAQARVGWILCYAGVVIGLCACDGKREVKDINTTLGVILQQTSSLAMEMPSLKRTYFLWDNEHKKVIGILKNAPLLQVGNVVVWDDDVYEVQGIRLLTRKPSETLVGDKTKTPQRSGDMQAFVKFVSKLQPAE